MPLVSDTNRTFHFISGLPRSGSTLLAAILRQNPAFHSPGFSPAWIMLGSLVRAMAECNDLVPGLSEDKRRILLRNSLESYYSDVESSVIFDNHGGWCQI